MYSKFDAVKIHLIHFIDDIYSRSVRRMNYNYLNDDSTKYFSLSLGSSTYNIIALHPSNGSHITTKIVTSPITSISFPRANGRFSNNLMLIHIGYQSPTRGENLILVNTDDWSVTTYVSSSRRSLYNYSPIFDTDQIMLLLRDSSLGELTLQTAYDKLDKTEFYSL